MPLLLSLVTAAAFAGPCDLEQIPQSGKSAEALLTSAAQLLTTRKSCEAARELLQARDQFPLAFVKGNGFFTLIRLETDLGQFDQALDAFKTWPWDVNGVENLNPWQFLPPEQEPGTRAMVWNLFARYIPEETDRCVNNPLTARCDEGSGLFDYDKKFAEKFPHSPFLGDIQKDTTLFYEYKIKHEMALLNGNISHYEQSRSPFPGLRPRSSGPQFLLATILIDALRIESFARPEDRAATAPIIVKYAAALQKLLAANPDAGRDLMPEIQALNMAEVIRTHLPKKAE